MAAPVLPQSWAQILDQVDSALAQAEAEAARSADALEAAERPADEGAAAAFQATLAQLDERLRRLKNATTDTDRIVADSAAVLQQNQEALEQWLAAAAELQRKLAPSTSRPLS